MTDLSVGWNLIGLSAIALLAAFVVGAFAFTMDSPRMRLLRRVSVGVAILAAITLIVVVLVGPGSWCGSADPYTVPGCA